MEAKQFQGKTLKYIAVEPNKFESDKCYPMVILLHGFGANMGDLSGLCPAIDMEGYVYVCPNGPIPVQIGLGMVGYAWVPPRERRTQDHMKWAVEALSTLVEDVVEQYRVEPGQVILGGFSQGGMLTYSYGLLNPECFKGLVVLSSTVPDMDTLRRHLPASRNQPIFISHGTADSMISVEDGKRSLDFLQSEGYKPEYHEYEMGHEINQDVLSDLVPWIQRVLPPQPLDS